MAKILLAFAHLCLDNITLFLWIPTVYVLKKLLLRIGKVTTLTIYNINPRYLQGWGVYVHELQLHQMETGDGQQGKQIYVVAHG